MDGRPWRGPPGGLKQWLVCQVLHSSRQKRRGPCASAKLESIREFQNHATARPYSLHLTWSSSRFFYRGFSRCSISRASSTSARSTSARRPPAFGPWLCSSSSCSRTSKSRWTSFKTEACRCTGRRRPAAGVARRVQRRQWSRRDRAADAAT